MDKQERPGVEPAISKDKYSSPEPTQRSKQSQPPKPTKHTETDTPMRPKNTSKKIDEQKLYGPLVQPIDPNDPSGAGGGSGKKPNGSSIYPQIYGGDYNPTPGHKDSGGADSSNPPPYDYVPAAEFPAGPLSPMPFLNDFSKILKYN